MKRLNHLYSQITSIENCVAAIINAAHDKEDRNDVITVLENIDDYAKELQAMLVEKAYDPSPYKQIVIRDGPSKKERLIHVPQYWPDQCVHHALMNILKQPFLRRMYYWSCGSLPDRGTKRAKRGVERVTLHNQREAKYAVQMDAEKFYASIPHDKLKASLRRLIKDRDTLWLIDVIIDSHDEGLPIGNYTSGWFANMYLTPMDWYIKQTLKVKNYVRNMDDIVLMGPNKRKLHKAVVAILAYVRDELGLKLHDDWNVFKVRRNGDGKKNRPIDFVACCFCLGYTTMRKRNALALMRQSRSIQTTLARGGKITPHVASGFSSRAGQLKYFSATGLKRKYVDPIPMKLIKGVIRNESKRQQSAKRRVQHRAAA